MGIMYNNLLSSTLKGGSSIFLLTLFLLLFFTLWFTFKNNKYNEILASLLYGGSALILTQLTNLLAVFCFIEIMMVSGAYLVFSGNSKSSYAAGLRYLKMHIISGIFILLGVMNHYEIFSDFNFSTNSFGKVNLHNIATYKHGFLALGLLINAATFPLSAWLPDSYPKASNTGSLTLAVFITKISIFLLAEIYWGTKIFIPIGAITTLYAAIYMVIENNLKRLSAYFLVVQNGILLAAVGIGGEELRAYFPLILSLSAIYSFLSMYIASHAAIQGLEYFSELSLKAKFRNNIWKLLFGFAFVIGFPFSVSYISKKLILIHSEATYFTIILNYSIIPLAIATYGKLLGYINVKKLPQIKLSIIENREYYFVLALVFITGVTAYFMLDILPGLEDSIIKLLYFLIALLISRLLCRFIQCKKYEPPFDIDWVYRVFLFNLYKVCTHPISRLLQWFYNNINPMIERLYFVNLYFFSERGLVNKSGKLYWAFISFILFILVIYYLIR